MTRKCAHPKCNRERREGKKTCSNRHTRALAAINYRKRKKAGKQLKKCPYCNGTGWTDLNPSQPV